MFKKIQMTAWLALLLACCQLAGAATLSVSATPAHPTAPAAITLSIALADNPEGAAVTGVEYFNGSSSLGVAGSAPFQLSLTDVAAGSYAIVARATLDSADHPVLVSDALALTVDPAAGAAGVYYIHADQINTPRAITNATGALVWQWDSDPFGAAAPMEQPAGQAPFVHNLRFAGQYYDKETNLNYNYFRDYDPQTGRYIESDPIGLHGGINTYAYVENSPSMSIDPKGLKKYDFNGIGKTEACAYYDKMAKEHPKCSYYKAGADICRGNNTIVNGAINSGIVYAWAANATDDSQATILEKIRGGLVAADAQARKDGKVDCNTDCVFGDDIDKYHNSVFGGAGINPSFYGGNLWPQGVPPNPVPADPRHPSPQVNPAWGLPSAW